MNCVLVVLTILIAVTTLAIFAYGGGSDSELSMVEPQNTKGERPASP
ncbi:hypothetical protein SCNU_17722 [Gordonia neofelifaecis NRRL B-59395]|uniref:Uncharacterized protein n=1 Tax=Gordonia neofelifaecis NRRL B-59395 TaxID=644548 RepID=F1YNP8_9ACTN|nr:hypothetical protein SCNU_17722 [Gordonia neofelifaecis NRRL B-59395]